MIRVRCDKKGCRSYFFYSGRIYSDFCEVGTMMDPIDYCSKQDSGSLKIFCSGYTCFKKVYCFYLPLLLIFQI